MTRNDPFSAREKAVIELLLKGNSNKQIAQALGISTRTVEFHLKNVYAKSQVGSRVEFILKLGKTAGGLPAGKLGSSTVEAPQERADNKTRPDPLVSRSYRRPVSLPGEELEMKNLSNVTYILLGGITALVTGFSWLAVFVSYGNLTVEEIEACAVALIAILSAIGLSVGLVGKRNHCSLLKVFFSTLFATSLSFFSIVPVVAAVVIPVGKLLEQLGFIDPAAITYHTGRVLGAITMIGTWLIMGVLLGIAFLFVEIRKPERIENNVQASENGLP